MLLYRKAMICQTFPGYTLADLGRGAPARDIVQAMEMVSIARQVQS